MNINEGTSVYSLGDQVTLKDPYTGNQIVGTVIEVDEDDGIYFYNIKLMEKHAKGFVEIEVSQGAIVGLYGQVVENKKVYH